MRFAPAQPPEGSHGHVHFEEQLHDSAVMVTKERDGSFLVKVGGSRGRIAPSPLAFRFGNDSGPIGIMATAPLSPWFTQGGPGASR